MKKIYRSGKFYVTRAMVEGVNFPDFLAMIRFVPFRVECLFPDRFEYAGESPLFDELKEGEVVPEYQINIGEDATGKMEVTATRLD